MADFILSYTARKAGKAMLAKYRTHIRQGILFGILAVLFGFGFKDGGRKEICLIFLAGLLMWTWGWWSLAKAKGQKLIGGWLVLLNFLICLSFLAITFFWGRIDVDKYPVWGKVSNVILLLSPLCVLALLFLPDKYKNTGDAPPN